MSKTKINRKSLKDQIKDILIKRIVEGELVQGDRLKELKIAQELGTSQAPVREAIRCLETLGYIEHIPHVGAAVRTFNRDEIEEAYQLREALEVYALERGNQRDGLSQELEEALSQMEQAVKENDVRLFSEADNRFHRAIIEYQDNKTMMSMWESLQMQQQVVASVVDASIPLEELYKLHPAIVKSLETNQFQVAALNLKAHYRHVEDFWYHSAEPIPLSSD